MTWRSDPRPLAEEPPLAWQPPADHGRPGAMQRSPLQGRATRPRRLRTAARLQQLAVGLGLSATGMAILVALMAIPQRFDGLLLVSKAIADLIAGLSRLAYGLLQLSIVLSVALLALLALLLLCGGLVRILRSALGRPLPLSPAGAAAKSPPAARTTRGR